MAAETTRVKDIPTTATTAAADDYVLLDGATNGTRKGLASNLITASAAAAVAGVNLPVRSVMAGNVVLTVASAQNQWLVPDADRDVTLPAEAGAAWVKTIHHAGTSHLITVKRDTSETAASLVAGATVTVVWDGTTLGYL